MDVGMWRVWYGPEHIASLERAIGSLEEEVRLCDRWDALPPRSLTMALDDLRELRDRMRETARSLEVAR